MTAGTRVIVARETAYGEEPPREVLVRAAADGGRVHIAIRERPGGAWGPPLEILKDDIEGSFNR